jgi:GNAT superfamily N-acetyltransferase
LENVVVAENFRGRGVGIRLMESAGSLSREAGCYKLVLSSNLSREEATDFIAAWAGDSLMSGFLWNSEGRIKVPSPNGTALRD